MMIKLFIYFFLSTFVISEDKTYVKNYYPNKKLKEEGWILNNKKTDYWFYYYENGNKKEEGHYKNNLKINWWLFYDENQIMIKKSEYKNGKPHGLSILFTNGQISKAEKYHNGKKIKTWTTLEDFKKDNN